jgi:hypothetical protein
MPDPGCGDWQCARTTHVSLEKRVHSLRQRDRLDNVDEDLKAIARSLVWWKPPEEVDFLYLVRRVMDRGTPEMVHLLRSRHGDDLFREALAGAEPGNFSEKSWNYWHLILGMRPTPPLPQRLVPPSSHVSPEIRRAPGSPTRAVAEAGPGS